VTVTTRISAVDVERASGSLTIGLAIERRSTATFVVVDRTGAASYSRGQQVAILDGANTLFAGYIDSVDVIRHSTTDVLLHSIACMDAHYLADKRLAAESYSSKTCKFIVEDLVTKYLSFEGITIGTVQTGPTIDEMIINYQPISSVYDLLAEQAGFIWYIDYLLRLYFVARSTTPAPFILSASDIHRGHSPMARLRKGNSQYRNRQYVRAANDTTTEQTETYTGDGVTRSFAMGYPLRSEPTITEDAAPMTVGLKGVDTAKDYYWTPGDEVIVATVAPANAVALVFVYYGNFEALAILEAPGEIQALKAIEGGTGIVEAVDVMPYSASQQAALEFGLQRLSRYAVIGQQFEFPIGVWGIEPGQLVTVNYPEYGFTNAAMLVEYVTVTEIASNTLRYTIRAIQGPELGDWTKFFANIIHFEDVLAGRFTLGSTGLLIIATGTSEEFGIQEAIVETVWACPICSPTTLCGLATIVC